MVITKPINEACIEVQELPNFSKHAAKVFMLRLDTVHPLISGNKWFKLKYNILAAQQSAKTCLATFGGAYSNHLIATASAAHQFGLSSFAVIRGQEHAQHLNSVLSLCASLGMQLHFVSRSQYAQKHHPGYWEQWCRLLPDAFWIPEGGANEEGRNGASEIMQWIPTDFSHIIISVGTGTTFSGLASRLSIKQHLLGFAPMKGGAYLNELSAKWIDPERANRCAIIDRFHFGGFGKATSELLTFMEEFKRQYHIDLDRVYTAKMMLGLKHLLSESYFAPEAKIICVHTGGLTGN